MRFLSRAALCVVAVALGSPLFSSVAIGVEVGKKAPDFSLPSTTGDRIQLTQFQGKRHVLVEFYISDFRPT